MLLGSPGVEAEENRAADEVQPPSKFLTGTASLGRKVCALEGSFFIISQTDSDNEGVMRIFSWFSALKFGQRGSRARPRRKRLTTSLRPVELLESRLVPAVSITEFRIPTQDSTPYTITDGPDGNLWFGEFGANRIGRITLAGVITEFVVPTEGSGVLAITKGPDGNVWFVDKGQIGRITPAGDITEFAIPSTAGFGPDDITAGPDGNLWFTEPQANKIGQITPSGVITAFDLPPTREGPGSIAAGADGNLWFT